MELGKKGYLNVLISNLTILLNQFKGIEMLHDIIFFIRSKSIITLCFTFLYRAVTNELAKEGPGPPESFRQGIVFEANALCTDVIAQL